MSAAPAPHLWERGRLDARRGAGQVLFGRMYEDAAIEMAAFRAGGRVLCIASAGCTAMALAGTHEIVAVDINPVQLAYAERRLAGDPATRGVAERFMSLGRALSPLVGWRPERVRAFLELDDPVLQCAYWRQHLDTARFRGALDGLLSLTALRTLYAGAFLDFLPPRLGAVMRARMLRCFSRHPNRTNPYARALLTGELPIPAPSPASPVSPATQPIRWVHADAAAFLEAEPAGGFDGFALSNILDGANPDYARRLCAAVRRAAAPGAMLVQRSFREPAVSLATNRAADDRAILWGIVSVSPAATLI